MKNKWKKVICFLPLAVFALLEVSPLLFLLAGTFMGDQEIMEQIAPVLGQAEGYASWRLIPQYPTGKNIAGLLFNSPEFFQMFWNSVKITVGILSWQKDHIYALYHYDDDAIPGNDAVRISGA